MMMEEELILYSLVGSGVANAQDSAAASSAWCRGADGQHHLQR